MIPIPLGVIGVAIVAICCIPICLCCERRLVSHHERLDTVEAEEGATEEERESFLPPELQESILLIDLDDDYYGV